MPKIRQRTCIGCRKVAEKDAMIRIARIGEGYCLDLGQRKAGRGAYVCSAECFGRALSSKGLERAFRCRVSAEEKEELAAQFAALPQWTV